jgi:hypothetical protein
MVLVKLHNLFAQESWRSVFVHCSIKLSVLLLESVRRSYKIINDTKASLESRKFINFQW